MNHRRDILKGMIAFGAAAVALPIAAAVAYPAGLPGPADPILAKAFNPFATGSAAELTHLVDSLVEHPGGDGAFWPARKRVVLLAAMTVLVWKRDQGRIALDAATVLEHLEFDRYVALASEPGLPDRIHDHIAACLTTIPGYGREANWHQTTLDQFEHHVMIFREGLVAMMAGSSTAVSRKETR